MASTWMLATALLTIPAEPPAPTKVIALYYSEIVNRSEHIVIGTPIRSESHYADSGRTIRTFVTFELLEVMKGASRSQTFMLQLEGGTIDGQTLTIPGMPTFAAGTRYLLFIRGNGQYTSPITGFFQGAFEIFLQRNDDGLRNMDGLELIGVRDDRLVFAGRESATRGRPESPGVGSSGGRRLTSTDPETVKSTEEAFLLPSLRTLIDTPATEKRAAPSNTQDPGSAPRRNAVPIIVSTAHDSGTRITLAAFRELIVSTLRRTPK